MNNMSVGMRIGRLRGPERQEAIKAILERCAAWSGSRQSFCEKEGISTATLMRWGRTQGPPKETSFVELRSREGTQDALIEIVLHGGITIRVPQGVRADDLRRVIHALSSAC